MRPAGPTLDPLLALLRRTLRRLGLVHQRGVLRVRADDLAFGERVLGNRRLCILAGEVAAEAEARHVDRVDDEVIVMQPLVVPGRARTIIATESPRGGIRIVVDPAQPVRRRAGLLALWRDAAGIGAHRQSVLAGRNV